MVMEKFLTVVSWGLMIWSGIHIILSLMMAILNTLMPEEKKISQEEFRKNYNVVFEVFVFIIALAIILSI